jgi:hypothetical protein
VIVGSRALRGEAAKTKRMRRERRVGRIGLRAVSEIAAEDPRGGAPPSGTDQFDP